MNEIVMEIMLIVLVVLALGLSLIIFNMYSQIRSIRKQVHLSHITIPIRGLRSSENPAASKSSLSISTRLSIITGRGKRR